MAQIIKIRRGPVGNLPSVATQQGELLLASGSISQLSGPFLTMTGTAGTGTSTIVGKIYQGSTSPDISSNSVLTGTPFFNTTDQALIRLNHAGNQTLDLTGNIEGNAISSVTIDTLDGDVDVNGDITGSNLRLTGDADIVGNIVLGGNITLGDQDVDFVAFKADVSSSLIPDVDGAFDLGSSTKEWANIYVQTLNTSGSTIAGNVDISGTLDVTGESTLASATVSDLTSGRVVLAGTGGALEDSGNLTFNGTLLTVTGNEQITGTLDVNGQSTLASLNVEDLTQGRVVIVGASGEITDDGGLTYNSGTDALTVTGDLAVNGGDLTSTASTFNLLNATPTTVNAFGNATAVNIGAAASTTTLAGDLQVSGNDIKSSTGGTVVTLIGTDASFANDVYISGSLTLLGDATELIISSSTVELDDNIIRLNSYAPFQRYAGFEVIDSGSAGVSASLQWDSQNDYWLIESSSKQSGKIISTTYSTFGSEVSLTTNTIPKSTGDAAIGDSSLTDNGSNLIYDTDAFNVAATSGNTTIKGTVTLQDAGGSDTNSNTSAVLFRNSTDQIGYVSTTETTNELDGILGYNNSAGTLVFSTVIDGGTF